MKDIFAFIGFAVLVSIVAFLIWPLLLGIVNGFSAVRWAIAVGCLQGEGVPYAEIPGMLIDTCKNMIIAGYSGYKLSYSCKFGRWDSVGNWKINKPDDGEK